MDTLAFIYSHLNKRKQNVKVSNIESLLNILVSGVPKDSTLGPILYNLFINDLFLFIKKANLANFADDKTIHATSKDITSLLESLKSESEEAINWFEANPISFKLLFFIIIKTLRRTTP